MIENRIFNISQFMQPSPDVPIRTVVVESADAVVVAWHVAPGQTIAAHVHPSGQDSWTILSGRGMYQYDADGMTKPIAAGDVVVAHTGQVHGVYNNGTDALTFISVVSPASAGYELI
jgi:quercetin dioxygenase-like cupin family protein